MKKEVRKLDSNHHYNTNHEIEYLYGLGTYGITKRNRQNLLENYIKSAHLRTKWGAIIPEIALKEAKKLLKDIHGKA